MKGFFDYRQKALESTADAALETPDVDVIDVLRRIANRAGAPSMHYFPAREREEFRESLDWIAGQARVALQKLTKDRSPR